MNNVPKYKRHSQMQTKRILSAAQRLFIENGIESVTLTQIAEASGVTRATLYKYFRSKERILWEIHHLRMLEYGEQLRVQLSAPWQTTYDRFSLFFNFLYQEFSERTDTFLFLRVFDSIYQRETAKEAHGIYETVFHPQDFGTGRDGTAAGKPFSRRQRAPGSGADFHLCYHDVQRVSHPLLLCQR